MKTFAHARRFALAAVPFFACTAGAQNALGQSVYAQHAQVMGNTQQLVNTHMDRVPIAQAPNPGSGVTDSGVQTAVPQAFDLTPVKLPERQSAFGNMQSVRTNLLYYLPPKMFFSAQIENSLRLETNAFQTSSHNKPDMVYRILPNVTLGYAPTPTTRVAANYFFFRDQYTVHARTLSRNFHSVGFRGDKDFILSPKDTLTASFFARELFISDFEEFSDLLPSLTYVHRLTPTTALYGSAVGQLRWRDVFGNWQEGDTFFSIGSVHRTPTWELLFDTTLVDNYGRPALRNGVANNHVMIVSLQAGRKISQRLPLTAFVRAEPIFNIGQENRQGFAGVNFRLFGGIRADFNKPAIFPVSLNSG